MQPGVNVAGAIRISEQACVGLAAVVRNGRPSAPAQ
jgi:hypothetical protein